MRTLALPGTIAFLIAFAARPGDRGLAVRAYVLFLAALALVLLARRLGSSRALATTSPIADALRPQPRGRLGRPRGLATPSPIADALRPQPERAERPTELVRIERAVALGASHA